MTEPKPADVRHPTQIKGNCPTCGKALQQSRSAGPPREPTQEMLMAGRKQTFADMTGEHCGPSAENTWKAMYDAALSQESADA